MKLETVRAILNRRPFRPLSIRITSGEEHRVTHPEQIALFPHLRTVVVGGIEPGFQILEVELIEPVRTHGRGSNSRSRGRGNHR